MTFHFLNVLPMRSTVLYLVMHKKWKLYISLYTLYI